MNAYHAQQGHTRIYTDRRVVLSVPSELIMDKKVRRIKEIAFSVPMANIMICLGNNLA